VSSSVTRPARRLTPHGAPTETDAMHGCARRSTFGSVGLAAWAGVLVGVLAGALGACRLAPTTFACSANAACDYQGQQGTCELTRYCSLPDRGCPGTERRYVEWAGAGLAGRCVEGSGDGGSGDGGSGDGSSGDGTVPDAPADVAPDDAPRPRDVGDGPPLVCSESTDAGRGSFCLESMGCACPYECWRQVDSGASSSCWARCNSLNTESDGGLGPNPDCDSGEYCDPLVPGGAMGRCLPHGQVSGGFRVKIIEGTAVSGDYLEQSNVGINAGPIGTTLAWGEARNGTFGSTPIHQVKLYQGHPSDLDFSVILVITFYERPGYAAGAIFDIATEHSSSAPLVRAVLESRIMSGTTLTKHVAYGTLRSGTVTLSVAGKNAGDIIEGQIVDGDLIYYAEEICGPDMPPPQDVCG
jgi:hypothetical protein